MTPFSLEGLINPNLNTRFLSGPERVDGLPSGHPNLDGGHPGLLKNILRGVLVVKVLAAPLRPKEVQNEAMKDVERLFDVRKAPYVVALGTGGVIFSFEYGFAK
jgi:hypothetical protein